MSESRTLARERGESEREHGEEKKDYTAKKGRFKKVGEGKQRRPPLEK